MSECIQETVGGNPLYSSGILFKRPFQLGREQLSSTQNSLAAFGYLYVS